MPPILLWTGSVEWRTTKRLNSRSGADWIGLEDHEAAISCAYERTTTVHQPIERYMHVHHKSRWRTFDLHIYFWCSHRLNHPVVSGQFPIQPINCAKFGLFSKIVLPCCNLLPCWAEDVCIIDASVSSRSALLECHIGYDLFLQHPMMCEAFARDINKDAHGHTYSESQNCYRVVARRPPVI